MNELSWIFGPDFRTAHKILADSKGLVLYYFKIKYGEKLKPDLEGTKHAVVYCPSGSYIRSVEIAVNKLNEINELK